MSYEVVVENVPEFEKRNGDTVIAGSNNSLIILGTDRKTDVDTGNGTVESADGGKGSGTISLVVGRSSKDLDPKNDPSWICLSMKTDVDSMAGSESVHEEKRSSPGAIVKSDHIRLVARESLKIVVGKCFLTLDADGTITLDGDVKLSDSATDRIIKGDKWATLVHANHTHPTPSGPSGPPIQPVPDSVFSKTAKV